MTRGLIWTAAPIIIAKAQKKKNDAKPERMNIKAYDKISANHGVTIALTIARNHAL